MGRVPSTLSHPLVAIAAYKPALKQMVTKELKFAEMVVNLVLNVTSKNIAIVTESILN